MAGTINVGHCPECGAPDEDDISSTPTVTRMPPPPIRGRTLSRITEAGIQAQDQARRLRTDLDSAIERADQLTTFVVEPLLRIANAAQELLRGLSVVCRDESYITVMVNRKDMDVLRAALDDPRFLE